MNKYLFGILLMISWGLTSCSFHRLVAGKKAKTYDWQAYLADTSKQAASAPRVMLPQPYVPDTVVVKAPDTVPVVNKLIETLTPIWKKRLVYQTFSGKAKVHFTGPEDKAEFTAHFRVRKDSIIWIAITGLGGMVPVARIYITPDSLIFVNQRENEVTRIPLSQAAKILPTKVDFSSMQSIIVGEPLRDGVITGASTFGGAWIIDVEDSSYIQRISYNIADSAMRTGQLRTRATNGPAAMIEYGGYVTTANGKVSTARVINIQKGNDVYSLDMNFLNVDFDRQLDFPVSVPENYTIKQ